MDNSSTTLADYFWIAGIENITYNDAPPSLDQTITEDGEGEFVLDPDKEGRAAANGNGNSNNTNTANASNPVSKATARHSRQNSANRLSRVTTDSFGASSPLSDEADMGGSTRSNRSSTTIRPSMVSSALVNGTSASAAAGGGVGPGPGSASGFGSAFGSALASLGHSQSESHSGPGDFDFDNALLRFAVERESFLEDLSFSAGAKLQTRPPMVNPRTERIKADESDNSGRKSPLRSIKGSIRRKLSFRDMNSMRKQPAVLRASASIRTAKRLSNYNSVIPPPEPLNTDPHMHPLKRRFEPTLLDRYPPKDATEELSRRGRFPDYVPMFAFPNDIQIVSSDDRPRSTWHGFTMTGEDNSKVYGVTVIVWTALKAEVAEQVEQRCEQWRQSHMSNEERELAASLGVRLAAERAYLSQLLAKLPTIPSGSAARETLDDQISAVEEKIGLMTEMLRPLRHGAASKIDGLTAGESGLWIPRAYGILGRDATKMAFWKEWLRAVIVPMTDGAVLRVPPSSPKVGRWQPLERYVVNLCTEAFSPLSSKTQVELGVRELRLYARKEALNELPGSRSTDLYALFRCLSLENVVALFEYAMSESRVIFVSSHTAMLHLACHALASLLYPLKWASIFIPVLPARLLQALEAPCPYIVGIEKRYENVELPENDYVLVDLDGDTVESTSQPVRLPRQHRRKLMSLLQTAAPHRLSYGVHAGPPPYAMESFPYDGFSVENESLFLADPPASSLCRWIIQSSSSFAEPDPTFSPSPPLFNAFVHSRNEQSRTERPPTSKSSRNSPPSSVSPVSMTFPPMPTTPVSRSDSGLGFSTTLREKRSGHFDDRSRRSSSFGMEAGNRHGPLHKPSLTFLSGSGGGNSNSNNHPNGNGGYPNAHNVQAGPHTAHSQSHSLSAISIDSQSSFGGYAPSTYAQSTLAASTVLPQMLTQPVLNTDTTVWVEGHCFNWVSCDSPSSQGVGADANRTSACDICDERCEGGDDRFQCIGCGCVSHGRCLGMACLVCPAAFHADRVRAAFVRCLASLLYTYRRYLGRPTKEQKANGQLYAFDMAGFIKSLPYEQQEYVTMMRDTQAFNEFIHERERQPLSSAHIRLFDEIILAKKARGRPALGTLSRLSTIRVSHGASLGASIPAKQAKVAGYLGDTTDHIWRTASVPVPNAKFPGDYRAVITRIPTRLDPTLMKEPRAIQGVPRPDQRGSRGFIRKQVPSTLNATATSPLM